MTTDWQLDPTTLTADTLPDPRAMFAHAPAWPILLPNRAAMQAGQFDAAALLWTDPAIFRAPFENAARVWLWINRTLQQPPLAGAAAEYLDLAARLAAAPPSIFSAVWSHPRAYHWTRTAYALLAACLAHVKCPAHVQRHLDALGHTTPAAALAHHLDLFKIFALALAHLTSSDLHFATPLRTASPLAIPCTPWMLAAADQSQIEILGLQNGQLQTSAAVRTCPLATHDGYALPVNVAAFNVPGLEIAAPALRAGFDYHDAHAPLLTLTLANIAACAPQTFAHFRLAIRLAALKPRDWGNFDDFSDPLLPGSFIASVINHPLEMGDHLIHEFQHNRMSFIEEFGPLFDDRASESVSHTVYYSPWRDKPRALYGVYHGVYVFLAVGRYWLRAYQVASLTSVDRNYVTDRLLRLPRQLRLALAVLRRHARLTPMGQTILAQFAQDVADYTTQVQRLDLPSDTPALKIAPDGSHLPELSTLTHQPLTVRTALREHLQRNDPAGQYANLLD